MIILLAKCVNDYCSSFKALASEVGDNFSIHNITSEGWRGRAQQICNLQQKVSELSEKLSLTNIPSIEKSVCKHQNYILLSYGKMWTSTFHTFTFI